MNRSDVLPRTFFLLCLLVGGLAASAKAWTTETYDNLGLKDGDTRYNGVALGNFKYYCSNGYGVYYDNADHLGSGSSGAIQRNWNSEDATYLSFTRSDRSVFSLKQIFLWDTNEGGNSTNTLKAFRSGVLVYSNSSVNVFDSTTKVFNWTNIDSVVILDSPDLYTNIDNLVWEPYVLPTVATGTKSGVTATAATLAGTVNANNTTTADSIQYGLTSSYGTTVVATPPTATGTSATPISASLSGLTPNTTYHYRVKATNSTGTSSGTDSTFTTLASPPTATTNATTGVGATAATLNGSVNANGASTVVTFQYGATTSYGTTVAVALSPVTGSTATAVSVALSGLTPITTYHFRVVAVNNGGTTNGGDLTFTTSGAAPTVVTGTKSGVTSTAATVTGTVNANNASTTDSIQYGTTTSYGTTVVASPATAAGTSATSISASLSGLTPNTTYHYCVKAGNATGTSYGDDSTFTTLKQSQTITFANPGAQTYGTTPTLTASSTSGLAVSFTSSTTGVCTITSVGVLTTVTTGTCTISADQAGDGTYAAATTVNQSFSVAATAPGAPTIGTATAGDASATVSFTAPASNGGAAITAYTVTSSPGGIIKTGSTSSITVTGLTNGTSYTFTVTATNTAGTSAASAASNSVTPQGSQTITFADPGTQTYGTTPTLTASSTSGLAVSFTSSTTGVCTITSVGVLTTVTTGTCTISVDQAGDAAYTAATTVTQSFSVVAAVPGAPTIGTATVGDASATVGFTAPTSNGGAAITAYTVTSSPGGIIKTGSTSPITVTGLTNGTTYTFTVTATNTAGTSIASAASNSVTPQGSQTITFANPGTQTYGTTPTLTASSTSGLAVSFTSSTTGVCTITTGGTLAFLATGTCTISADQAGDAAYTAASTVSQSFAVEVSTGISTSNSVHRVASNELAANIARSFGSLAQGIGVARIGTGTGFDGASQSVDVVLPGAASVLVSIFDNLGTPVISWSRDVASYDLANLDATGDGRWVLPVAWNARAANGEAVPAGVYLWKIVVRTEDGRKLETVKKLGVK